jgi:lipopolysaccharide export system protein LptC
MTCCAPVSCERVKSPLVVLVLLLALLGALFTFTQNNASDAETVSEATTLDTDYDYYIEDILTTRFDADGQAISQLRAERVTHYPEGDRAELQAPRFINFAASDQWQVSAETGTLAPDVQRAEDRLDLRGEVELDKPLASGGVLAIRTTALSVYTDTEEAVTTEPVSVITGGTRLEGLGMRAMLAENYVTMTNGRGTHDPTSLP